MINIKNLIKNKYKDRWIPYLTYALIGINIIIFLIEELNGGSENVDTSLRFGALFTPYVIINGQLYRIFTSMFLHFGVEHIGSNMISLYALGPYVEHYFGHMLFIVLYIFSGLCGNMATMLYEGMTGNLTVSCGASGAIFGLLSVFLLFAFNERLRRIFPVRRVFFAILLSLTSGLTDPSINFMAHFGGFIGGLVLSFIMQEIIRYNVKRRKKSS